MLSERQIQAVYVEAQRDENGEVIFSPPEVGRVMTPGELEDYTLFLLGIRDPALVKRAKQERAGKAARNGHD